MRSSPKVPKHRRQRKILAEARGYRGRRSKLYRSAKQQVAKSLHHAFVSRKLRKRDFRKLWIARISAAVRQHEMSYSRFINGLMKAEVKLNRKQLSEIAIHHPAAFKELLELARKHAA
jgi:large subunit ribosomal protein L20